jgi:hypothetical protein
MKITIWLAAVVLAATVAHGQVIVGGWATLYKGIDHAVGTNIPGPSSPISIRQVVHCVKVDLSDPDVQLFATPRAPGYVAESRETLSLSVSNLLKNYGLKVAINAGFYDARPGGSDPGAEGIPCEVHGLQISQGNVVSAQDSQNRYCALMFTTDKTPSFAFNNRPPGTNTSGIYTAITGYYPVLTNGVNLWDLYYNDLIATYPDSFIHQAQPRTAVGVSQDNRYLFLMTIDGRQGGYSDGAYDSDTGFWLLQFGAWNGINMDGGGSTSLYRADSCGNPQPLNHSSYVAASNRERYIGSHFGVFAQSLATFIYNANVLPGSTTATINWTTLSNATSQVDYGLTTNYGSSSVLDPTPVTSHEVTLSNLTPAKKYYFRIHSSDGSQDYTQPSCGPFLTTNEFAIAGLAFNLTNAWKFTITGMDATPDWKTPGYKDGAWSNSLGVLWCDDTAYPQPQSPNAAIQFLPLAPAPMPVNSDTYPFITYYLRTRFNFTNNPSGATLTFSNYLDDGAVFYLNGVEIQRTNMPPSPVVITSAMLATSYTCAGGNATCPVVFTLSGDLLTNLVSGTNLLAVEVHNYSARSPDITFGCALSFTVPPPPPSLPFITNIVVVPGETGAVISWTTRSNSSTRVQYGLTQSLGTFTPLDATPRLSHSVTLTNLQLLSHYFFQVISSAGANQYTATNAFSTVPFYNGIVALTNSWNYNTNNLDGTTWQAPAFDDSLWPGGPALLWVDQRQTPNPDVQPEYTPMPWNLVTALPWTTYYFRSAVTLTNTPPPGFSVVFSNFVDDGAVFYLNGAEIQRLRMPPAPEAISNSTFATGKPATDDAVSADVFRLWGSQLTNFVVGTNVLAFEVHNVNATSPDVTFGSSVGLVRALASETAVAITSSNTVVLISWPGSYLTLQQSSAPANTNSWSDVPGPVTTSPFTLTNPSGAKFYRLRN